MGLFRRRSGQQGSGEGKVPDLVPIPKMSELPTPKLQSPARYLGTLTAEGEKVVGRTLSAKSSSRLHLSEEALDVVRMAGSFRIPVAAMRGATSAAEFDGTRVESLLVVRWEHGERQWRTGFGLEAGKATTAPDADRWVRTISKMTRKSAHGQQAGQEKGEA